MEFPDSLSLTIPPYRPFKNKNTPYISFIIIIIIIIIAKYLNLDRELKKTMEYESDSDTDCCWGTRYSYQRIDKGTEGLGNKRTSGDYPNYSIAAIDQNTEKSPGDLLSLRIQWRPSSNAGVKNPQKQCEKKDKYLDIARELKKLWNMKVTILPIVIGGFGTVT